VVNPLKEELFKKIPSKFYADPSFITLVELIKEHNLEEEKVLTNFLDQNVTLLERQVEKNRNSAFHAKMLHDQIMHLEALKKCQSLARQFLKG